MAAVGTMAVVTAFATGLQAIQASDQAMAQKKAMAEQKDQADRMFAEQQSQAGAIEAQQARVGQRDRASDATGESAGRRRGRPGAGRASTILTGPMGLADTGSVGGAGKTLLGM